MKRFSFFIVLVILLTACGPTPTPAPTPNLAATAAILSGTMVAGTLTAQPTNTLAPTATPLPTATPTLAPTETATPAASPTLDPLAPPPTLDPALATPTVFVGQVTSGNFEGLTQAILHVENWTGVKEIIVTINGTTIPREQALYLSYKVTGSYNISLYTGRWQIRVEIPGKRFLETGYVQGSKDKTTLKVYLNKLVLTGP